ncbi:MAG: GNAT family N-acetyltransferase [Candidatus Dadabacteria bacterium]|nr:MAG: GNAT family N-acetyltransferase [Candidatus Dadabacteria bacterium]
MSQTQRIELRRLEPEDYAALREATIAAYGDAIDEAAWSPEQFRRLLSLFPEGQFCVEVDGRIAAAALSIVVRYERFGDDHTYDEITGDGTFATHDPKRGNVLYGIDVFVHPEYRGMRLARRLYDARKELCEQLNLRAIVIGGRLPGYAAYADRMTPQEYVRAVALRELSDPVLSFQLANDFRVKKIMRGYLPGDRASKEYAALLEWNNIYYDPDQHFGIREKSAVRIAAVQWQMRPFGHFDAFMEQVEFFVDAAASYNADFVVFPEYFDAPLMAPYDHLPEAEAIRELASHSAHVAERLRELAVSYNINVIGGSLPVVEDGQLMNAGWFCRRDGSSERYEKLHITPSERSSWGMQGGHKLNVFSSDCGPIAVAVCYDIEFPELGRMFARAGAKIVFVPFQTDTQNGYMRVRHCAQSRAIENECYVVIAGCVGNLPRVNNMDIQYAQSAILTPSDFAFPTTGVKTEATPNTEMMLIADVDLDSLRELHEFGSVRTLKDRRGDLYSLHWKGWLPSQLSSEAGETDRE